MLCKGLSGQSGAGRRSASCSGAGIEASVDCLDDVESLPVQFVPMSVCVSAEIHHRLCVWEYETTNRLNFDCPHWKSHVRFFFISASSIWLVCLIFLHRLHSKIKLTKCSAGLRLLIGRLAVALWLVGLKTFSHWLVFSHTLIQPCGPDQDQDCPERGSRSGPMSFWACAQKGGAC